MNMRLVALFFAILPLFVTADDMVTHGTVLEDSSRVLRQGAVVNAPLKDVWHVFTTSEGWENWAVVIANVDLHVGGIIETSYDRDAGPGDPSNIHNKVWRYQRYYMLSIQAVRAPPGFPHPGLLPNMHSVFELEAVDEKRTRVIISGVGYGEGEGYDERLGFFRQGDAWTFEKRHERVEQGSVDWSKTWSMQ